MTRRVKIRLKRGPKGKYKKAYPGLIYEMSLLGKSYSQFCAKVGISNKTMNRWMAEYPEFREACEAGQEAFTAYVEGLGMEALTGERKINEKIWDSIMKNRCGWGKEDKVTNNISIENLNVLNQLKTMDVSQIENEIKRLENFIGHQTEEIIDGEVSAAE